MELCAPDVAKNPAELNSKTKRLFDAGGGWGWRVVTCDQEGVVEGGGGGAESDDVHEGVVEKAPVELWVGGGEDHAEDENDFEESGELAENAGGKRTVSGDEDDDGGNGEHENVAADDDDGGPPGDAGFVGEDDEGRGEKEFVGDGVEVGAEG